MNRSPHSSASKRIEHRPAEKTQNVSLMSSAENIAGAHVAGIDRGAESRLQINSSGNVDAVQVRTSDARNRHCEIGVADADVVVGTRSGWRRTRGQNILRHGGRNHREHQIQHNPDSAYAVSHSIFPDERCGFGTTFDAATLQE